MQGNPGPAYYVIADLLDHSVQPFDDMDSERFEELKRSIKSTDKHIHRDPLKLTEDGLIMWDGNQRCRALLALGRKRLDPEEVRLVRGVDRDNAKDAAISVNNNRRHQTAETRAAAMWRVAGDGWSRRRIAKAFSMTASGVTQLMNRYPPADASLMSGVTIGKDGKTYSRTKPKETYPRSKDRTTPAPIAVPPWSPKGEATRGVENLIVKMNARGIPENLTQFDRDGLRSRIVHLVAAAEAFLRYLDE